MNFGRAKLLIAILAGVGLLALLVLVAGNRRQRGEPIVSAPETVSPAMSDPWKEAALKVEADRGEPTGRQAQVDVPAQLKHYSDRRRFLGIQVAESMRNGFQRPHDFAELAALIRKGELVELSPLGEAYILYGVGLSASDERFTHYDRATDRSVPLYANDAEIEQEYAEIADSLKQLDETLAALKKDLSQAATRDRALRTALQTEISDKEKLKTALKKRKTLLDDFYKDADSRDALVSEHQTLAELAASFGEQTYDLQMAAARKAFKVRMLSFLRPEALRILEEVARSYQEKFDRHLPITSLVRPDEYQRQLHETNPNATLIEVPPHTTGLAFDIYYRFMTADEQTYLMAELARLQDEGKVEALRENRDHFHVFAFAEGRPPDEKLIGLAIKGAAPQLQPANESKTKAKKKLPASTRR